MDSPVWGGRDYGGVHPCGWKEPLKAFQTAAADETGYAYIKAPFTFIDILPFYEIYYPSHSFPLHRFHPLPPPRSPVSEATSTVLMHQLLEPDIGASGGVLRRLAGVK